MKANLKRSRSDGRHLIKTALPPPTRDDVYLHGALRLEARAAIRASRAFLKMALRHLRAPHSPLNGVELRAFMSRYLST